jgi:phage FluMu gp28-like protein
MSAPAASHRRDIAAKGVPTRNLPPLKEAHGALMQEVHYVQEQRDPGVFLGFQSRWACDKARVKVCEKSRRIGLSWSEAEDAVECAALSVADGGMDVWYIGYNKDMAIEFILDCAQWAQHMQGFSVEINTADEIFVDGDERQSVLTYSIKFGSGHRITALTSNPRSLRGKQGRVIIDEAAFHTALAELLKAAMALLIWGGEVRIISTHNGDDNPFNQLIKDVRAGRLPYSIHRITFAQAIAEGLYKAVCARTGKEWTAEGEAKWEAEIRAQYGDDAEEELDCVPKHGTGAFLTRELVENCMRQGWAVLRDKREPDFTFKPERTRELAILDWCEEHLKPELDALRELQDVTSFLGADFARVSDLSAFLPLVQFRTLKRRVPFIVELRGMPFTQQRQVLWYIIDRLPRFVGAALDARGLGMQMSEETAQRYGQTRILMIQATQPWYLENLQPYKAAFEDSMIELPMDADVLTDHRVPRVIKGIPQIPELRTTDADKKKRHGDTFIAGALAWHASRVLHGTSIYEYQAAPPRSMRWDGTSGDRDTDDKHEDFSHGNAGAW